MRECGGGAGFAREPLAPDRIACVLGRQRLQRDRAAEPRVLGGVDDAHAAAADFLEHAVGADLPARQREAQARPDRLEHQLGGDAPGRLSRKPPADSWRGSSDRTSRGELGVAGRLLTSRKASRAAGVALERRRGTGR